MDTTKYDAIMRTLRKLPLTRYDEEKAKDTLSLLWDLAYEAGKLEAKLQHELDTRRHTHGKM